MSMEFSLLCDEVLWLSSPNSDSHVIDQKHYCNNITLVASSHNCTIDDFHMTKEDCEESLIICLEAEKNIHDVPYKPNYIQYLESKDLSVARFKSIQWFIKCRNRLNLSFQTVFYAANYLDRFISLNLCNEWKDWMVELLSIACLSIASKFGDTTSNTPTFHEINQINRVDDIVLEHHNYLFEPSTIQRMELVVLKALDWRLACTTAHSYVEMFSRLINVSHHDLHRVHMISHVNDLLLMAISDIKMVEFKPSVVAISALRCCLDTLHDSTSSILAHQLSSLIPKFFSQDQKDDLARCHEIMEMQWIGTSNRSLMSNFVADHEGNYSYNYSPSSPTTVLLKEQINVCDFHFDLSLFKLIHDDPNNSPVQPRSRKKQRSEDQL